MNDKLLEWAVKIQSIAQSGLAYCKDEYDRERYETLRNISAEMRFLVRSRPKKHRKSR